MAKTTGSIFQTGMSIPEEGRRATNKTRKASTNSVYYGGGRGRRGGRGGRGRGGRGIEGGSDQSPQLKQGWPLFGPAQDTFAEDENCVARSAINMLLK